MRIYSSSTEPVVDFPSFAKWHAEKWGKCYTTPKSIEEVHRLGFNIHPANKGQDSIRNSIDILKRQPLLVTRESTNLIKELRNYTWDTDKTGASLGVPVDRYNHAIDAVRYVALNKLSANAGGRYVIM